MRIAALVWACLLGAVGCDDAADQGIVVDAARVDASGVRNDAAVAGFDATVDAALACSFVAGLCPQGCHAVIGSTIDASTCVTTETTLVCVRSPIANQANSCVVDVESGTTYWLSVDYGFQYGSTPGWRPCTGYESGVFISTVESCRRKDGGASHSH